MFTREFTRGSQEGLVTWWRWPLHRLIMTMHCHNQPVPQNWMKIGWTSFPPIFTPVFIVRMRMKVDLGRASRQESPQIRRVIFARQPYDGLQLANCITNFLHTKSTFIIQNSWLGDSEIDKKIYVRCKGSSINYVIADDYNINILRCEGREEVTQKSDYVIYGWPLIRSETFNQWIIALTDRNNGSSEWVKRLKTPCLGLKRG